MLITGQEVTNVTGVLRMLTVPSYMHFVSRKKMKIRKHDYY